jgi:hypothetical protein
MVIEIGRLETTKRASFNEKKPAPQAVTIKKTLNQRLNIEV